MKAIALLQADLSVTPLGTRSRLAADLAGTPVLRRTVERLQNCTRLADIVIAHPPVQAAAVNDLLTGLRVTLEARDIAAPYADLVRVARKWSLDGWRGGIGGSTSFDEYLNVVLAAELAERLGADLVVSIPPGAAVIDPGLVDAMIAHAETNQEDARIIFTQTPPGLAPFVIQKNTCKQLAGHRLPPGWTLAYKPTEPRPDLTFSRCCFPVEQAARYASGRLTADTDRSFEMLKGIIRDHADGSATDVGRWMLAHENDNSELPREVEIELTTADPLPATQHRPRGSRIPTRGPLALEAVDRIAADMARLDDSLVVLGGHGEPVLHPNFADILQRIRSAGVYGLTVYTTGQQLDDSAIAAMVANQMDAVVVHLDAWTQETYARIHGGGELGVAVTAIERLVAAREAAHAPAPLIVPQFTKSKLNVHELDAFYDGWIRRIGAAVVAGHAHYAGTLEELGCIDMTPPARAACRRLSNRLMVLADGSITACDQDVTGGLALGHLATHTLRDVWNGPAALKLRASHAAGAWSNHSPCNRCAEWHRP